MLTSQQQQQLQQHQQQQQLLQHQHLHHQQLQLQQQNQQHSRLQRLPHFAPTLDQLPAPINSQFPASVAGQHYHRQLPDAAASAVTTAPTIRVQSVQPHLNGHRIRGGSGNSHSTIESSSSGASSVAPDSSATIVTTSDHLLHAGGGVGGSVVVVGGGGGGLSPVPSSAQGGSASSVGGGVGGGPNSASTPAASSSDGYFIFSDLTTALQEQQQQQQQHGPELVAMGGSPATGSGTGGTVAGSGSGGVGGVPATVSNADGSGGQQQHQHQLQLQHQQQQQQQHNLHGMRPPSSSTQNCCFESGDAPYHFKTLVPSVAAGAIIGKGGDTIAALQKDTGARVKMSKSHDFYPGTSERVCLVTGSMEAIMTVLQFIMDKIREKPDMTTKMNETEAKLAQERDRQVKILVPNSTAGMIIGKAGAYIKQIKEESGSYVQISQKPKDITLQERCITIIGEPEKNKIACRLIIAKIMEDPQSGTCLNVSYAEMNGPVANFNPTGSPYATNQNAISSSTASLNSVSGQNILMNGGCAAQAAAAAVAAQAVANSVGGGINLSLNLAPGSANAVVSGQMLEHIKAAMRASGYSEPATNEVCQALAVLAKYGVLGGSSSQTTTSISVQQHSNGSAGHHAQPISYMGVSPLDHSGAGGVFGAIGQVSLDSYMTAATSPTPRASLERYEAQQFDPFRHVAQQAAAAAAAASTPMSLNNNSFGLATSNAQAQAQAQAQAVQAHQAQAQAAQAHAAAAQAQAQAQQTLNVLSNSKSPTPGDGIGGLGKDTKNMEIPEVIVGAILGPSGRSLVEIQQISGASIQISKKGTFAPGTRNRIVTISGQQNALNVAAYLIDQKIQEEESKRARHNPVAAIIQ